MEGRSVNSLQFVSGIFATAVAPILCALLPCCVLLPLCELLRSVSRRVFKLLPWTMAVTCQACSELLPDDGRFPTFCEWAPSCFFYSSGMAVQILHINEDHSFDLNESQLEAILLDDRVKDKPVVVVSVAGAYRQGKSFLLSFLLRYLRNNCRSDWLDDPSIKLDGFEWSPGRKPHTTGILVWNEAFLVTTPQGEEVAVLLMDTQGSFDCKSTVKECTTIFALSIMTSSVQVYNVWRNIQEDQLQHLQFFAEYGKLAQKGARNQPFQRLVFLVRDWAFSYDTDYGAEGGSTILQELLAVTDKQPKDLQLLRRQIWSSFSKIEGFLMPRPGDKVERDHTFDGRLEDMDMEFKEKLKELVPWLLAPENLVVKKINGNKMTCQELMNYFRVYVKTFQGGHLPEPKSVLQATAEASNVAAKEKATRLYMEGLESRPRGKLEELLKTHITLLAEARELFRETPKVGEEEVSQRYLEAMEKELKVHFGRLYKEEELLIQREKELEEQREREREEERQREERRKIEREIEKERGRQREREREAERQREEQRKIEREKEEQQRMEAELKNRKEIEILKQELKEKSAQDSAIPWYAWLNPLTPVAVVATKFVESVAGTIRKDFMTQAVRGWRP
ncbi:atlastin-1-like isoform X1 [Amblyomma americanum]